MWEIKNKNGETLYTTSTLEYNGSWMDDSYVSIDVQSAEPINFSIGDYVEYRGEKFVLANVPAVVKRSSKGSVGDAFKYSSVKFSALSYELTNCKFLDVVLSDNNIHYTALPDFTFYASTVQDLADRIQANLDRMYKGEQAWTVTVVSDFKGKENISVSCSNINVWEALALCVEDFEAYFIVRGRTIEIGISGLPVDRIFKYGKGNGLYEIESQADTDQAVVTRVRAYGSTKNIPNRYYNKITDTSGTVVLPDNMAVKNLMLPGFPLQSLNDAHSTDTDVTYSTDQYDPYVDSLNADEIGIIEESIFFDGSNDMDEIYPSLEGMTADDLHSAGISVTLQDGDNGNLDEILDCEQITDNGVFEEGDSIASFKITIKDIGFNINDYLSTESAKISMKDGMCGGREFEILSCTRVTYGYELTCNRVEDSSLDLYFPYKDFNIKAGDKFVLLNIEMPDVYIKAASERLLTATKAWLAENDMTRYTYAPKVDEIFMARQHDMAVASGWSIGMTDDEVTAGGVTKSLHDTIKEGSLMLFSDDDLGIDGTITIDTLKISEGSKAIPTYTITLRDDKAVGSLQKIQNKIDSIASGSSGGNGGGYTSQQIRGFINTYGKEYFLKRTENDGTEHNLSFGSATVGDSLSVDNYNWLTDGYIENLGIVVAANMGILAENGSNLVTEDELIITIE